MEYTKPNFNNCIINVSATLAEYLGVKTDKTKIDELEAVLAESEYKNVVFICFDGMGEHPLSVNLAPNSFLRSHVLKTITSTFPSTTTNATTSMTTCAYPLEHGWFGWSLHFEEIGKNVDIFLAQDSQTGEKVECAYPIQVGEYYFDKAIFDGKISLVAPKYLAKPKCADFWESASVESTTAIIERICARNGKQFVYAYCPEPDYTMHEFGVTSLETNLLIGQIDSAVKRLCENTPNTLFVITADHGQVDISGDVEFWRDEELCSMLKCPPYLDARTPCFCVKEQFKAQFEQLFEERYGQDFMLRKTQDLIDEGYFGVHGDKGHLLGDYIAIGTFTHKVFIGSKPRDDFRFLGHHTSTTEEMLVPLIVIQNK